MRAYFAFAAEHRDEYRLMYRENLVGENESDELATAREDLFAEITQFMLDAQAAGAIAVGDPQEQVLFCWAPFHGMASFVLDQHLPVELFEGMLERTIESVLRGLGCETATVLD